MTDEDLLTSTHNWSRLWQAQVQRRHSERRQTKNEEDGATAAPPSSVKMGDLGTLSRVCSPKNLMSSAESTTWRTRSLGGLPLRVRQVSGPRRKPR